MKITWNFQGSDYYVIRVNGTVYADSLTLQEFLNTWDNLHA